LNILYICHRFPYPPKRGGKIRPFNMIQHLSKKHNVTVVSIVRSEEEAKEGEGLKDFCNKYIMVKLNNKLSWLRTILNLLTTKPSSFGFFYSPEMKKILINEYTRNHYDLIFVHCSSVAPYVAENKSVPKIIDFGDMDSQKWLDYSKFKSFPLSLGYKLEGTKLEAEEKRLAKLFTYSSCTTRAEFETLASYNVTKNIFWFPNGVDYEYFKPSNNTYKKYTICFIGRMDYYPNQECMFRFCKDVFPIVKEKVPDAKLTIIGANPTKKIMELENLPGVKVTGSVDDVRPYVLESAVNVAPLNIARGTQNKILESMAMGVPVIASSLAANGIDAIAGEHLLVADSAEEYVNAILQLFSNPLERNRLSRQGRERMLSHHDWEHSMKKLDMLIDRCISM